MTLVPGTRLGVFEIVALIGAGGMGEVYRARDSRLGRDVAIKVLPDLFAQDAERLSRLQREAQLLASLNHQKISAIHGLEDTGSVRALVLELVHGETIADRLQRGPMPVEEVVATCRQIAEALEAAHERGIIHRDLKPANVKVTPEGKVKVLDFGLAKAVEAAPASSQLTHSPTLSLSGTFAGVILGTVAYMSPEQAKGLPADQRSDVFSFGCLLYEMLTGRQAFQADTASETMAAVLLREVDLIALPQGLQPRLVELVRRCTDKNPKRRWQAIGDVRFELEAVAADPSGPAIQPGVPQTAAVHLPTRTNPVPILATAVIVAAVSILGTRWAEKPAEAPVVTRFEMTMPEGPTFLRLAEPALAFSPDGTKLVYAVNRQLYMRPMSEMTARPVPGTGTAATPFFSPDGQWIGFFAYEDSTIKKVAVTGGSALTVCKTGPIAGATWEGNYIVFAEPSKGIMRVSANGGQPDLVATVGKDETPFGPQLIDGGNAVLYTITSANGASRWDRADLIVEEIGSGKRKVVVRGGSDGRYTPTGHIVYALTATILAVPFDLKRREITGGPIPLVESVMRAPNPATQGGVAHFATSANGSLAYIPTVASSTVGPKLLALVDMAGKVQPIGLPPQSYVHPRMSPRGTQLAISTEEGKDSNIWVYDLEAPGSSLRRLTFGGRNQFPIWSPDGRYIAFQSDRDGDVAIFRQLADGSGPAERLTKPEPGSQHEPESWSPDGKTLSFNNVRGNNQGVWTVNVDGERKPTIFADSADNTVEKHSMFSPDGRWIAYMTAPLRGATVNTEVFVQPFPPSGVKYQVSTNGGRAPRWSPDGKQLYYNESQTNQLFVVDVRTTASVSFGQPRVLPIEGTIHPVAQRNYDLTADGRQLLVVRSAAAGTSDARNAAQLHVVLSWFEELKARVPATK